MNAELEARTLTFMGRSSIRIGNGLVRATVDLDGGMVPELGIGSGENFLNLHWIPPFRQSSGEPWSVERHGAFWKSRLLHSIAGDFLCSPNFGPDCIVGGVAIPAHGWTANAEWSLRDHGADAQRGFAYADFSLGSPAREMPLAWTRRDYVIAGQSALFTALSIRNRGTKPLAINLARHNTVGAPFLETGCRISLCSRRFMTAPAGTEFDDTGRLAQGVEFASLAAAPLREGGTVDLSVVPGRVGATDFLTGAVPRDLRLGWSCILNPRLGLAYLCLFPGPRDLPDGEIALSFNDLWMQYGGRPFTPWAESEGGQDRTFCLGTENSVGAFANGLAYSRAHPELLGAPTMVEIPAGGERRLHYATALLSLGAELRSGGISRVDVERGALVLANERSAQSLPLSADFELPRRLCRDLP